jgi:hypothetical protein
VTDGGTRVIGDQHAVPLLACRQVVL